LLGYWFWGVFPLAVDSEAVETIEVIWRRRRTGDNMYDVVTEGEESRSGGGRGGWMLRFLRGVWLLLLLSLSLSLSLHMHCHIVSSDLTLLAGC